MLAHDLAGKPGPTHRIVARGHAFPDHAIYPPQRARKPRQPPAWAFGVPICSTNSSLGASSSIPGSSGGRTMGITGIGAATGLPRSARARNIGAGATGAGGSVEGPAATGAGAAAAG